LKEMAGSNHDRLSSQSESVFYDDYKRAELSQKHGY